MGQSQRIEPRSAAITNDDRMTCFMITPLRQRISGTAWQAGISDCIEQSAGGLLLAQPILLRKTDSPREKSGKLSGEPRLAGDSQMENQVASLLAQWRAGNPQAAEQLFQRYADRLIALARSRLSAKLSQRIDAED